MHLNEELPPTSVGAGEMAGVTDNIPVIRKHSIKRFKQFLSDKLKTHSLKKRKSTKLDI